MSDRLERLKKERAEQENYRGDVIYDVWWRGGNPDLVDYDNTDSDYYEGLYPEESASRELRRQKPRVEPEYPEELEAAYG